jgi:small redox-active disulfide protein 2
VSADRRTGLKVQILGTGCPRCRKLEERVDDIIGELGIECEVEKVSDIKDIMAFGVMMTPALAIDGEIKSTGKLLSVDEIKELLQT